MLCRRFVSNGLPVLVRKGPPVTISVVEGERYAWCSCGLSTKQPMCNGAHKGTGMAPFRWIADRSGDVTFCMCKHTSTPPFCDGSHSNISTVWEWVTISDMKLASVPKNQESRIQLPGVAGGRYITLTKNEKGLVSARNDIDPNRPFLGIRINHDGFIQVEIEVYSGKTE